MVMLIQSGRFGGASSGILDPTWLDPSHKGANMALSNNNLTVTKAVAGKQHATARHGKASGKWRYQATITDHVANEYTIGVIDFIGTRTEWLGSDSHGAGLVSDGRKASNGSAPVGGGITQFADGDVVDVYVDADAKLIWFGKNGVISGNPTAGTGGTSLASMSPAFFPDIFMDAANNVVTLNFGGPFTHNLHPTFLPWSAVKIATRDNFRAALINIRDTGWFGHSVAELALRMGSGGANVLQGAAGAAQNVYQTFAAANAFDGNGQTEWVGVNGGQNQGPLWLRGDTGSGGKAFDTLELTGLTNRGAGSEMQIPTLFDLWLSPDNIAWDKAAIGLTFPAWPLVGTAPNTTTRQLAIPAYD